MASLNDTNTLLNNTIDKYHHKLEITGDPNTYYPVTIVLKQSYRMNKFSNSLFVTRNLYEKCYPNYPNCHSNTSSSLTLNIVYRTNGWDGCCNDLRIMKYSEIYSKHIGKIMLGLQSFYGIVIWLRGGGTVYNIWSKYPLDNCTVYYSRTNIQKTDNPEYCEYVEPLIDPPDIKTIIKQCVYDSKIGTDVLYARTIECDVITASGNLTASKVYNAVWNDYAELFERGEKTEAGDIIALDISSTKEQYIKADSSSKRVIGVHSDTYGHLIGGEKLDNYEDNFKNFIPIGLAGRVNVKVKGKVQLGDYIVPSDEKGIGRVYNKDIDNRDMIIGYLVEADDREDIRRLKMFINKK